MAAATSSATRLAGTLALGVPALLLAGVYIAQYGFGLYPCEMCWWQRWTHFAAVALALVAFAVPPRKVWLALAALAILTSGAIGMFHAGVEYHWWEGITGCTTLDVGTRDPLEAVLAAPIVRCDEAAWRFFGLSLAGWNAVISVAASITIFVLLRRSEKTSWGKALEKAS